MGWVIREETMRSSTPTRENASQVKRINVESAPLLTPEGTDRGLPDEIMTEIMIEAMIGMIEVMTETMIGIMIEMRDMIEKMIGAGTATLGIHLAEILKNSKVIVLNQFNKLLVLTIAQRSYEFYVFA